MGDPKAQFEKNRSNIAPVLGICECLG